MLCTFFQDPNLINVSNFEECSLCPTVSIEHGFLRQHSKSHDEEETEIHWKLIPITGKNQYTQSQVCFFLLRDQFPGEFNRFQIPVLVHKVTLSYMALL